MNTEDEKEETTVEAATIREVKELKKEGTVLGTVAVRLARYIDQLPNDASPSTVARLAQELRTTMASLKGVSEDVRSEVARLFAQLSSPVRYGENAVEEDAGT